MDNLHQALWLALIGLALSTCCIVHGIIRVNDLVALVGEEVGRPIATEATFVGLLYAPWTVMVFANLIIMKKLRGQNGKAQEQQDQ